MPTYYHDYVERLWKTKKTLTSAPIMTIIFQISSDLKEAEKRLLSNLLYEIYQTHPWMIYGSTALIGCLVVVVVWICGKQVRSMFLPLHGGILSFVIDSLNCFLLKSLIRILRLHYTSYSTLTGWQHEQLISTSENMFVQLTIEQTDTLYSSCFYGMPTTMVMTVWTVCIMMWLCEAFATRGTFHMLTMLYHIGFN